MPSRRSPLVRHIRPTLALVLVLGVLVGVPAPSAGAATVVPFGAHAAPRQGETRPQAFSNLESQLGRPLSVVRMYYSWNSPFNSTSQTTIEGWARANGKTPVISVKTKMTDGTAVRWADIANATSGTPLYDQMVQWATRVKTFPGKVYFCFNHEPSNANSLDNGTAPEYIAAWQKIRAVFNSQGVTNVSWTWIMGNPTPWEVPTSDRRYGPNWYPGDASVDVLGIDVFNFATCNGGTPRSFANLTSGFLAFAAQHQTKQTMVTEFGTGEQSGSPNAKADWITQAAEAVKSWPNLQAFIAFNSEDQPTPGCQWWLDTSTASLNAARAVVAQPYFGAPPPATTTYTFASSADATIDQAKGTTNYGADTKLVVDGSPVDDSLLQFNVSTTGCSSVSSATLRLTNNSDGSVKGGDFYAAGSGWSEGTVNWNTAPARGTLLGSLGAVSSGATYTVGVTGGVTTLNGPVSFRVGTNNSDGARYYPKEGSTTAQKPQLTVICNNTPSDTLNPTAPSDLTATAPSGGEVDLGWTGSFDNVAVTGYRIYRGPAGTTPLTLLGTTGGTTLSYQDMSVVAGTPYDYQVTAVDAAGNESLASNTATVTPAQVGPAAPTGLGATATGDNEIDLAWTASTGDPAAADYNVYRGPAGGAKTKIATGTGGDTTFEDTTVNAGTSYDYQVTAVDGDAHESPRSNNATATTTDSVAPDAPTGLGATAVNSGRVDLSWTASHDNVAVTGYRVYRAPTGTTPLTFVGSTSGFALSYQDTTVGPASSYDYQVTAVDAANHESSASNPATATTPPVGPQTYTFASAEDATIDQTHLTTNYGADTKLVVDHSPVNDFLVKFNVVTTQCRTVTAGTLRLTIGTDSADGSDKGGDFYPAGSGWSEGTVNWNTAPARGTLLASLASVTKGTTYTVNVTAGVSTLNGPVSFRIASISSDGARYWSKEGGTAIQKPQLTVTCTG